MSKSSGGGAQERYDRMLTLGAGTVLGIIPLYFAVSLLFLEQPEHLYWSLGIAWIFAASGFFSMRRDQRVLARACILATLLGPVSVLVLAGGPHSSHVGAIFPAIAGSAFLLSTRATIGTSVWFCLVFGTSLVLEQKGVYLTQPEFDAVSVFAQIATVCAFVVSVLYTYQRALEKLTHQQEELTLRKEEAAALVEGSPDGVALLNEDHSIRSLNPALSHVLGEGSPIGPGASAIALAADEEGIRAMEELLAAGGGSAEFRLASTLTDPVIVSVNAQRLTAQRLERCVQLTLRNVTQEHTEREKRLQLERRLRQSEKMEAFGQLAGGVAHDFNNLLTGVMGHAELVERALDDENIDREYLKKNIAHLLQTADRGADITRGLLSFSHNDGGQSRDVDVTEMLNSFEPTLRRLLPEDIELDTVYERALYAKLPLRAVEQIVMNLVTNARHAMESGGKMHLQTSRVELENDLETETGLLRSGGYLRLTVSDTGAGMPEEVRARVFEPFFSTRRSGVGTGLGLSTVHGIVTRANGGIRIETSLGLGTTVSVYLPRVQSPMLSQKSALLAPRSLQGTESILVCEDEQSILSVVRRALEQHGYRVFGFDSPLSALAAVKNGSVRPQLLLTDVVMPGMNGRLLSEEVKAQIEDLPILFMSGHTDGILETRGVNREEFTLLQKPFTSKQLLTAVRESLGGW